MIPRAGLIALVAYLAVACASEAPPAEGPSVLAQQAAEGRIARHLAAARAAEATADSDALMVGVAPDAEGVPQDSLSDVFAAVESIVAPLVAITDSVEGLLRAS